MKVSVRFHRACVRGITLFFSRCRGSGVFLKKAAVSRDDLISTSGKNFMDPFLETTVRGTGSKGVMDFLMVVPLSSTGSSSWRLLGFT